MQITRRSVLAGFAAVERPNILFFFPDQQRWDWNPWNRELPLRMPNLEALGRRGMRFSHAMVAAPVCAPSRACLAAGKEYERCGVPSNNYNYPLAQPTYYRLLRDSGYHVMGCGKLDLNKKDHDWGLDGRKWFREWGFSDAIDNEGKFDAIGSSKEGPRGPYMAYLAQRNLAAAHIADFDKRRGRDGYTNTAPTPLDDDAYCDNWIARNGLELLRAAPKGKPWHLVVNFAGPHNPVDITSSMERVARGRNFPQPHRNTQVDAPVHNALRQNYAAMLENIDRWLGEYSEELRRRGEWNNTIIVYSSDHGEMLGDHDRWAKGVPHEASVRVPLVMAGPGIGRGQSPELVYVHDLAATYLDYGGVPTPSDMDSKSLRPLLEGKTRSHRKHLRLGLYEWRAVTDGRYKLVKNFDNKPVQLFDLRQDPWEDEDIATRQPAQVKRLEALLR